MTENERDQFADAWDCIVARHGEDISEPIEVKQPRAISFYDSALINLASAVPHLSPRQAEAILIRLRQNEMAIETLTRKVLAYEKQAQPLIDVWDNDTDAAYDEVEDEQQNGDSR